MHDAHCADEAMGSEEGQGRPDLHRPSGRVLALEGTVLALECRLLVTA